MEIPAGRTGSAPQGGWVAHGRQARDNSVLQRVWGTGGEQRLFILQRVFGCSAIFNSRPRRPRRRMMPLAVAAATRAISWSSGAERG